MDTREQLAIAMDRAHRAGDTAGALQFARALQQQLATPAPTAEPEQRSTLSEFGRQAVGLPVRQAIEGATGMLALPGDLMGMDSSGAISRGLDMLGFPKEENQTERLAGAINRGAAGAFTFGKAAEAVKATRPAVEAIRRILAEKLGTQTVAGGVSGAAHQTVLENGGDPLEATAAGLTAPIGMAAVQSALAPVGRSMGNLLSTAFGRNGPRDAAGRVAVDIGKERSGAIAAAMRNGEPMETAAQAAVPAGSAEFSALERIVGNRAPSVYGPREGDIPKAQAAFEEGAWGRLNAALTPNREKELIDANAAQSGRTLTVAPILQRLQQIGRDPEDSVNPAVQHMLSTYAERLLQAADPVTGEINARSLYGIRKVMGDIFKAKARSEGWDKKRVKGLTGEIQSAIDDEIIQSSGNLMPDGNPAWTGGYMNPFAEAAQEIDNLGIRRDTSKRMASDGMPEAQKIYRQDELPVRLPQLLSRPAMVTNAALRWLEGHGGDRTMNELVNLMQPQSKDRLAAIMEAELGKRRMRVPLLDRARQNTIGAMSGEIAQ